MTHADKAVNPQHFGSDPVNISIRIGVNPEIQIRIPDHFRLTFRPWQSLHSSNALVFLVCTTLPLLHHNHNHNVYYLRQRRRYMFLLMFVCLFVCLLARLLKNACMDLDEMLRVDRCRDMDELMNF